MSNIITVSAPRMCARFLIATLVTAGLFGSAYAANATEQPFTAVASAMNRSTLTSCGEDDNVNVPISDDKVRHFVITAAHPTYTVGIDNCEPDATCPIGSVTYPPNPPSLPATGDKGIQLYDDHDVRVEGVRGPDWWLSSGGMSVSVDNVVAATEIHYIRIYRKIADAFEWPQFFVLYADGNVRLIPHPPVGRTKVCFGSSVIVGPAAIVEPRALESRPYAEIASVNYLSAFKTLEINYRSGGSASLDLKNVNRTSARIGVTIDYPTDVPFATLRSNFVRDDYADTANVKWQDPAGVDADDPIIDFLGGDSQGWLFHRNLRSTRNTSAPDISIRVDAPRQDTMAVDFDSYGIWLHQSDGSWTKLHDLTSVQLAAADLDGNGTTDQVVNFAREGLWVFMNNKTWVQLHSLSPALMAPADLDGNPQQDLVVDFAPYGIWVWMNNNTWVKLHDMPARSITAADLDGNGRDEVVIDFNKPHGLWIWTNNQTWRQLHTMSPALITAADLDDNGQRDLVIDFAPYGIWKWMNNASWVKLHDLPARSITAADLDGNGQDELVIDFNPNGLWIWTNNETWRQLHSLSPHLVTGAYLDDNRRQDLVVDFAPYGIWQWMNDQHWVQLHSLAGKHITAVQE